MADTTHEANTDGHRPSGNLMRGTNNEVFKVSVYVDLFRTEGWLTEAVCRVYVNILRLQTGNDNAGHNSTNILKTMKARARDTKEKGSTEISINNFGTMRVI